MKRDIFFDTEFLDGPRKRGGPVETDLISIALVDLNGRECYAIVDDVELLTRAAQVPWMRDNVLRYLPGTISGFGVWSWDKSHPDFVHVKPLTAIANEVFDFVFDDGHARPKLWAFFAAHDHVLLTRLWGKMVDAPVGIPHRTGCLAFYWELVGYPPRPPDPVNAHDARADAHWNVEMWRVCQSAFEAMVKI